MSDVMVGEVATLAAFGYAVAYYAASARIGRAPRLRLGRFLKASGTAAARQANALYLGNRLGKVLSVPVGAAALFLLLLHDGRECRKCWPQTATAVGGWMLWGAPWSWSWRDLVVAVAAAGLAIFAYEGVLKR